MADSAAGVSEALETSRRAEQIAHRAEQKADSTANAVMAALGRIERELKAVRSEVKVGLQSLRERIQARQEPPAKTHSILEHEDWEDSPTGMHKMVSRSTWERWEREKSLDDDGRRWRRALNLSGKIALAIVLVIAGWLVRHYLGKP